MYAQIFWTTVVYAVIVLGIMPWVVTRNGLSLSDNYFTRMIVSSVLFLITGLIYTWFYLHVIVWLFK